MRAKAINASKWKDKFAVIKYESIPLIIYVPTDESWPGPQRPRSRLLGVPSAPPSGDPASGTRHRSAPLGTVARRLSLVGPEAFESSRCAWESAAECPAAGAAAAALSRRSLYRWSEL